MAELLIRNIDRVNNESTSLNARCFKRGDVLVVMEDGWEWSPRELAGDPWDIIKFPGATVEGTQSYLTPVYSMVSGEPIMVIPRASYFNLDAAHGTGTYIGGDAIMLSYQVQKEVIVP